MYHKQHCCWLCGSRRPRDCRQNAQHTTATTRRGMRPSVLPVVSPTLSTLSTHAPSKAGLKRSGWRDHDYRQADRQTDRLTALITHIIPCTKYSFVLVLALLVHMLYMPQYYCIFVYLFLLFFLRLSFFSLAMCLGCWHACVVPVVSNMVACMTSHCLLSTAVRCIAAVYSGVHIYISGMKNQHGHGVC